MFEPVFFPKVEASGDEEHDDHVKHGCHSSVINEILQTEVFFGRF
jgi:hypothetical protein